MGHDGKRSDGQTGTDEQGKWQELRAGRAGISRAVHNVGHRETDGRRNQDAQQGQQDGLASAAPHARRFVFHTGQKHEEDQTHGRDHVQQRPGFLRGYDV